MDKTKSPEPYSGPILMVNPHLPALLFQGPEVRLSHPKFVVSRNHRPLDLSQGMAGACTCSCHLGVCMRVCWYACVIHGTVSVCDLFWLLFFPDCPPCHVRGVSCHDTAHVFPYADGVFEASEFVQFTSGTV